MHKLIIYCLTFVCCLPIIFGTTLVAQQSSIYTQIHPEFRAALSNFSVDNFALAQKNFNIFLQSTDNSLAHEVQLLRIQAQFYHAICATKLQQPNAELLLSDFLLQHSKSQYAPLAHYELGQIYFNRKKYKSAIAEFKQVDALSLDKEESGEYYFKYGYSLFTSKKFPDAKRVFSKIIKERNQYYFDANYYYGIISFFEENYTNALNSFQKIEQNPKYSNAIPYYISLIYYYEKQDEKLLNYAAPKADKKSLKYRKELNQLVGQTYFNHKKFKEALPYLSYYVESSYKVRKEDVYQLGFAQYQNGQYQKAIKNFTELNTVTDSLGQNAMYHLADCYLKINDKEKARNAFDVATRMQIDNQITETSAFNYAKLSYDLGFANTAITSLRDFITDYPKSSYSSEAKQLLTSLFETTQNYGDALAVLESIPNKSHDLNATLQRMLYYRGVELYNDKKWDDAIGLFDKTIDNGSTSSLSALAHFWKGDIFYKKKKYEESFNSMEAFLAGCKNKPLSSDATPSTAKYTMAYILFKQKEYESALEYFDGVADRLGKQMESISGNTALAQIYPDAVLRSGDCNFMLKNYNPALKRYNIIINQGLRNADYAYYQRGMLHGLMGEYDKKTKSLNQLLTKHPKSNYNDDAVYQIAITHIAQDNYEAGINTHKNLIKNYPGSNFVRKSMIELGLAYFNTGKHDLALDYYGQILKKYPKSNEAQLAISGSRDVFVEKGDADGYAKYLKKFPNIDISISAQDSLSYEIAESYYTKGDCSNASKEFTRYLTNYANGAFALPAHYYRAQCLYSEEDYLKAGKDYDFIIAQERNMFTENAVDKGARIAMYIVKDYTKAYTYYTQLYELASRKELKTDALRGLVKTSYMLQKPTELNKYAELLLIDPDASTDDITDTYYYMGMSDFKMGKKISAEKHLQTVSKRTTNEKGATARYYIAELFFQQKQYDKAKDQCFKVINETASQPYWVVKSFVLLSDIYLIKNEPFQAKATLESVIQNYSPEDELKKEARNKLAQVKAKIEAESKIKDESDTKDDYLEMEDDGDE